MYLIGPPVFINADSAKPRYSARPFPPWRAGSGHKTKRAEVTWGQVCGREGFGFDQCVGRSGRALISVWGAWAGP